MLSIDTYLESPPAWAKNGAADQYSDALAHFDLPLGRNPSSRCPHGGHGNSNDPNLVVYERGVMCYSRHGFIPRSEVIALAGLPPSEAGLSMACLAEREVGRFVAEDQLTSLLEAGITQRCSWDRVRTRRGVDCLVKWSMRENGKNLWWRDRLDVVCSGTYPRHAREFLANGVLVHRPHRARSALEQLAPSGYSYVVESFTPREPPKAQLSLKLAPALAAIGKQRKAFVSASIERLIAGEADAISRSSLVAVEVVDRPVPGLSGGWRLPLHSDDLPLRVYTARLSAGAVDTPRLLRGFLDDLRRTFPFKDEESLARYLAYLVQPMIVPRQPGTFPCYWFTGPTHSGKTYLAGPLPRLMYGHSAGDPVFTARIPDGDYEMAVQLEAHTGALYALFDEAIDASERQLKAVDQMVTSPKLVLRRMRVGYVERPNWLTFAFTAVDKSLPPETAGRTLSVNLTEPRPEEIAAFNERWCGQGAKLLGALFERLSEVMETAHAEYVPHRRPGFGVLKAVLKAGFSMDASFGIEAADSEILDVACRAFTNKLGTPRTGGWQRISFSRLAQLYCESNNLRVTGETMRRKVFTALGYTSTRRHPVYGEGGYPAEDGKSYEIEIRNDKDGGGKTRAGVYVREAPRRPTPHSGHAGQDSSAPADSTSPNEPAAAGGDPGDAATLTEFDLESLERDMVGGHSDD